MTMPNITFCMSKNNAWSHFNQTGLTSQDLYNATEEGLAKMADSATFLNNDWDYKMVMDAYLKWLNEIAKRNVSFDEFRQKVGWETLRRSQHRFERLDVNKEQKKIKNDVKITWLSTRQLCFQPHFDANSFVPIADQALIYLLIRLSGIRITTGIGLHYTDFLNPSREINPDIDRYQIPIPLSYTFLKPFLNFTQILIILGSLLCYEYCLQFW
ncbi:unnamed protein product [Meloidogyne enterolobii]|uniref:Uncharacterized protein n=1 Tax=Meloidogyne enterolobii TaxID=390850 RepID=A0ACB0ZIS3_MELEN